MFIQNPVNKAALNKIKLMKVQCNKIKLIKTGNKQLCKI